MTPSDRAPQARDVELAETFAEVARALLAEGDTEATLTKISCLAVATIKGCDHAGVTLVSRGKVTTQGASDEVPVAVDKIQYEVNDGPCLQAYRQHEATHVDDLSVDKRWPEFSKRAASETGVRSMISFRLFAEEDSMGALNLYSRNVNAFDDEADHLGAVFAAHAAVAMVSARESEMKDQAIRSRDVIGQAKGILMARSGISEQEAFEILRRSSQRMNVKLRDVAEQIAKPPSA